MQVFPNIRIGRAKESWTISRGAAQSLKIPAARLFGGGNMNFLSLPRGPYGRCSSTEGWKDKKAGRRERELKKTVGTARLRGIFRIEFPRWFPWFCATVRKEERVGASSLLFLPFSWAATPSFPRLNSSHPFPLRARTLYFPLRLEDPSAVIAYTVPSAFDSVLILFSRSRKTRAVSQNFSWFTKIHCKAIFNSEQE